MAFLDRLETMRVPKITSTKALWWGIAFTTLYVLAIVVGRPLFVDVHFVPDTGYLWYFWRLPEPETFARITAWGGYFLHQVVIWGLIYYGQTRKHRTTKILQPVNVAALAANGFFVWLHLGQTWVAYDGLAADTPIWSSQYAVIVVLVLILLMENRRRGLIFGKKFNMLEESARSVRKYHGYVFSWAVIYTFWFHPMEDTLGHLLGTFYTVCLMLQGSLMFTRSHTNKWWTTFLEIMVLIHGSMVAYLNFDGTWPFFLFGFAAIFVVTQMHGLNLALWLRWAFVIIYLASAVFVFGSRGELEKLPSIGAIATFEIGMVFVFAFVIWLATVAVGWITGTMHHQVPKKA